MLACSVLLCTTAIGNPAGAEPYGNCENIKSNDLSFACTSEIILTSNYEMSEMNFVFVDYTVVKSTNTCYVLCAVTTIYAKSMNLLAVPYDPGLCRIFESYNYLSYVTTKKVNLTRTGYATNKNGYTEPILATLYRCRGNLHVDPGSC